MAQTERQRLYALDGLRGACAISIVVYHASKMLFGRDIVPSAFVAVDLFFIMSGYVVALAYERRLVSGMGFAWFARARLARLGPTYLVGAAIAALVTIGLAAFGTLSWGAAALLVIAGFLLMPAPSRFSEAYGVNGPAWSLFAELVVNVAYGSILYRLTTRQIFIVALAGYVVLSLVAVNSLDGYNFGWRWDTIYQAPIRALAPYLSGVLIYRLSTTARFQRLPDLSPFPVIMIFLLGQFVSPSEAPAWVVAAIVAVVGTAMVALLVRSTHQPASYAVLGRLSYPLYATHYPILVTFEQFGLHQPDLAGGPLLSLVPIVLIFAVARVTDRLVSRKAAQPTRTGSSPGVAATILP